MQQFKDKTALITGAANGFGREFAREGARRGMNLVLVDIEEDALDGVVKEMQGMGAKAVGLHADVSLPENVQKMVKTALDTFGSIDLLINNAGVYFLGSITDVPARDVQWMMEVNALAGINAMKEVIPVMRAQGTPCHILNVCSVAGLLTNFAMSAYFASKHAFVAASESVALDLQKAGDDIKVSIFCPGYVQTSLHLSQQRRPARFQAPEDPYYKSEAYQKNQKLADKFITTGSPIDSVANLVFTGIEKDRFYITMHDELLPWIKRRHDNIQQGKNPDLNNMA